MVPFMCMHMIMYHGGIYVCACILRMTACASLFEVALFSN